MAEIPLTDDDVKQLAESLDQLDLIDEQKGLLAGLISLAAASIAEQEETLTPPDETVVIAVSDPSVSFREQFSSAFLADENDQHHHFQIALKIGR